MDDCATCRVLAFVWASLVTGVLCWLLTRNTGKSEFQSIPIWALEPERSRKRLHTRELGKSLFAEYRHNHSGLNNFPHPRRPAAGQTWGRDPRFHQRPREQLVFQGYGIVSGDPREAAGLKRVQHVCSSPDTIVEAGLAKATYSALYPTQVAAAGVQAALQEGSAATRGRRWTTWAIEIHTPASQNSACAGVLKAGN